MRTSPRTEFDGLSLLPVARVALYAGLFMVSLLVFRLGSAATYGDVLLIAAFALASIDTAFRGRRVHIPVAGIVAVLLIAVGGIITSLAADDTASSALAVVRVIFLAFLVPWTLTVLLSTPNRVKTGVGFLAAGAATCAAGSVLQLLVGDVVPGSATTSGGRYPGFAVHVSDTGGIVSLAVVYGAGLLFVHGRFVKLIATGILAFGLAGLILSGSVSGMIAAVVGVLALLVWLRLSFLKMAVLCGIMSGVAIWAIRAMSGNDRALTPLERFRQATGATGDSSLNTSAFRMESIVAGWEGFANSPFVGAGLEPVASITIGNLSAHNLFVAILFQGGLLFTMGVCAILFRAVRQVLPRAWAGAIPAAAAAGLVTALTFAMTSPSFYNRYLWLPVALAIVVARTGWVVPKEIHVAHKKESGKH